MVRRKEPIVYLDAHVVMWLYDALTDRLSKAASAATENNELRISWMVKLELQYLNEIGKIRATPEAVFKSLSQTIGLRLSDVGLDAIVNTALGLDWTKDVFDRMIVAECITTGRGLITKDVRIRSHAPCAIW